MRGGGLPGLLSVPVFYRLVQGLVLIHNGLGKGLALIDGEGLEPEIVVEHIVQCVVKQGVVGRLGHRAVELVVDAVILDDVVGAVMALIGLQTFPDIVKVALGGPLGGQLSTGHLQIDAHFQYIVDGLVVQGDDLDTLTPAEPDVILLLQLQQGLSHRGTADAQLLTDGLLGVDGVGLKALIENGLFDQAIGLLFIGGCFDLPVPGKDPSDRIILGQGESLSFWLYCVCNIFLLPR